MYPHEPPVVSENPPVLSIFPKSQNFHKVFYSEIFKNIRTGGYNLQQNQRTAQIIGTHLRLTSFTVRESGRRMGIATNSL
jgi:hypothetical protein